MRKEKASRTKKPFFKKLWFWVLIIVLIACWYAYKNPNKKTAALKPIEGKAGAIVEEISGAVEDTSEIVKEKAENITSIIESAPQSSNEVVPDAEDMPEETSPSVASSEDTESIGLNPDLKAFLDSYEAFIDEYCEFMEKYDKSDLTQLAAYTKLMARYHEFAEKVEAYKEKEMSQADELYYIEVINRCNEKMMKTAVLMDD